MTKQKKLTDYKPGRGFSQEDWNSVSDHPEWTAEDLKKAKPFSEVFPEMAVEIKRGRGRPPVEDPKRQVTLRLDSEVIERFKAEGPGWQSRINETLRRAIGLI